MKKKILMRLYRIHDLDLITFIQTHELDFPKAVYCSLKAFTKGETFVIKIPPKRDINKELILKRNYTYIIYLDEDKDKKEIILLEKIAKGNRNNFLKNLLRLYLCNPMSELFLVDEKDEKYFYEKFDIFRKGRKFADLNEIKELNSSKFKIRKTEQKKKGTSIKQESKQNNTKSNSFEKDELEDKTSEAEENKEKDVSEKEIQRTENVTETVSEPEVVTEQENESESEDIADMFSSFLE